MFYNTLKMSIPVSNIYLNKLFFKKTALYILYYNCIITYLTKLYYCTFSLYSALLWIYIFAPVNISVFEL